MPKRVSLPDGSIGEFPDEMGDDQIAAVLRKQFSRPIPEGVEVTKRDVSGRPTQVAPKPVPLSDKLAPLASSEFWGGVGSGLKDEVKGVGTGISSLFRNPETPGERAMEYVPGWVPTARLMSGELQSRGKLTSQAAKQFHAGHPVLGTASTILSGLPIPGVAAMGSGVNESNENADEAVKRGEDEWAARGEGVGRGAADVGMLGSGFVAKGAAKVAPPMLRRGAEILTKTGPKETAKFVEDTKAGNAKTAERISGLNEKRTTVDAEKAKKAETANKEALAKHDKEVAEADKVNLEAHVKHLAEKSQIERANQEAEAVPRANEATGDVAKARTEEMDVRIEKARHDALEEGNKKYNAVNEELNHIQADPEFIQGALVDAMEKIKGTSTEPTIFKDMSRKIEHGEVATYEDLQGYYSELGNEISKGTLPGDVYHAYDTLHESIGKEMQRIADSEGKGAQLKDARAYWKRMKQTFGKSSDSVNNRAGKAVSEANPDYVSEQQSDYQLRLLGSFDAEIPKLASEIKEAMNKLKAPASEKVKPVPEASKPVEVKPPNTQPVPKPRPPLETPVKKIGPEEVQKAKSDRMQKNAENLRTYGLRRALYVAGVSIPGEVLTFVMGHPTLAGVEAVASPAAVITFSHMAANLMEKPSVVNWLSKPTAGDLEALSKLPAEQRTAAAQNLQPLIDAAKKKGIKVSPTLVAFVGGTAVSRNSDHPLSGNPVQ
jgi:hypothetical protein